jgi:hypothetical protein
MASNSWLRPHRPLLRGHLHLVVAGQPQERQRSERPGKSDQHAGDDVLPAGV